LSLHSSEALQGLDLSCPLFTCTNANQAATCTCNTRSRVNPHHVVNHSSQLGATIHRSSGALVLRRSIPSRSMISGRRVAATSAAGTSTASPPAYDCCRRCSLNHCRHIDLMLAGRWWRGHILLGRRHHDITTSRGGLDQQASRLLDDVCFRGHPPLCQVVGV
jgi:hypothetical protein